MAKPNDLIGIGEFARRTRLTAKQLRNYDELGLLVPAYVDPDSQYRYYHRRQARTAITIALLRSLELPLGEIHDLLVAEPEAARAVLERQRAAVESRVDRDRRTIGALERLLGGDDLLPYDVVTLDLAPTSLIGLRRTSDAAALDDAVPAAIAELAELLPEQVSSQPVSGLYPLDLDGEVAFFVGVEHAGGSEPGSGLETVPLSGGPVAATSHVGGYAELRLAYYPLLAHLEERSLRRGPRAREIYREAPPEVAADRAVTEIHLPYLPPESAPSTASAKPEGDDRR